MDGWGNHNKSSLLWLLFVCAIFNRSLTSTADCELCLSLYCKPQFCLSVKNSAEIYFVCIKKSIVFHTFHWVWYLIFKFYHTHFKVTQLGTQLWTVAARGLVQTGAGGAKGQWRMTCCQWMWRIILFPSRSKLYLISELSL